jgi:hypothetical protein
VVDVAVAVGVSVGVAVGVAIAVGVALAEGAVPFVRPVSVIVFEIFPLVPSLVKLIVAVYFFSVPVGANNTVTVASAPGANAKVPGPPAIAKGAPTVGEFTMTLSVIPLPTFEIVKPAFSSAGCVIKSIFLKSKRAGLTLSFENGALAPTLSSAAT